MKRLILFLTLLCVSAGVASADYLTPPGWNLDPNFTHQEWNFITEPAANEPADVDNNPYGVPTMNTTEGWMNDLGTTGRQGGVIMQGPLVDEVVMDFTIPNKPDLRFYKEIYFEAIIVTNALLDPSGEFGGVSVKGTMVDDQGNEYSWLREGIDLLLGSDAEVVGAGTVPGLEGTVGDGFGHAAYWTDTSDFGIDEDTGEPFPCPEWETLTIEVSGNEGYWLILDEIDFDTRCIPEPSTIAMLLGLAVIGLIAFIRRRR